MQPRHRQRTPLVALLARRRAVGPCTAPDRISVCPNPFEFRPAVPAGEASMQLLPFTSNAYGTQRGRMKAPLCGIPVCGCIQVNQDSTPRGTQGLTPNTVQHRADPLPAVDHPANNYTGILFSQAQLYLVRPMVATLVLLVSLARSNLSMALMPPAPRCISPIPPPHVMSAGVFRALVSPTPCQPTPLQLATSVSGAHMRMTITPPITI